MHEIILIATVHKERGICNSNELYKIIEQINPDIIFEELPPEMFAKYYEGLLPDTLEITTIKKYLQQHKIVHIPADLDGNKLVDLRLKSDIMELFDILSNNMKYVELANQLEILSAQYGFPFLNGNNCREIMERLRLLEEGLLSVINNEKLSRTYKTWLDIQDKRENEMINNIYSYSDENKYRKALFLIGAEHRKSITDKIPMFERNNRLHLNWDFNYFD